MKKLLTTLSLGSLLLLPSVSFGADVVNSGFEDTDVLPLPGWTAGGGTWFGGWPLNPDNYTGAASQLYLIHDLAHTVTDGYTGTHVVFGGNNTVRLNNTVNDYSVTVIRQTVTNYSYNHLYFAWNAVLEPSHDATDSPNFTILVRDLTTGSNNLFIAYSAYMAQSSSIFRPASYMVTSDWKLEDVTTIAGHDYEMIFLAADCPYGRHRGYVYVDGFGGVIPSANTEIINEGFDPATDTTRGSEILIPIEGIPDIAQPNDTLTELINQQINPKFAGGTLYIDANGIYTRAINSGTGGTINTDSFNFEFSGNFRGAGNLEKAGLGTLTLSGNNSFGNLTISNGMLILSGLNNLSGATLVTGTGTILDVNGELVTVNVIVNVGSIIQGIGKVNSPLAVFGHIAPGNSPGTLTVAAPVVMADGSGMSVEIDGKGTGNGAGNYDRLVVTGAGNQFLLGDNVTLSTQLRGISAPADNTFNPALGDSFRIVSTEGGVSGRFTTVEQPADGMATGTRLKAFYNVFGSNSIDLRVIPDQWSGYLAANGGNENAQAAGQVLDTLIESDAAGTSTQKQQELLYSVAGATADELPDLTTELSGEMHAALAAEAPLVSFGVQSAVSSYIGSSRLGGTCQPLDKGIWFSAVKTWDQWQGDSVASTFDADRYQYVFGYDFLTRKNMRLGGGYSYSSVNLNHSAYDSNGAIYAYSGFIYGQYKPNGVVFEGIAALGPTTWKTKRADPLGLNPMFSTVTTGMSGLVGLTVKMPMEQKSLLVEPYASATWIHNDRGSVTEGDAQAALSLPGYNLDGARLMAGVTVGSKSCDPILVPSTFSLSLGVGYDTDRLANPNVDASLADVPFTIQSPDVSQLFVKTEVGGTVRVSSNGYLYANYAGMFRSGAESHGVELGAKIAF